MISGCAIAGFHRKSFILAAILKFSLFFCLHDRVPGDNEEIQRLKYLLELRRDTLAYGSGGGTNRPDNGVGANVRIDARTDTSASR